ncbi:MAG TPA: ABC transporter permease [Burkholderiales bacterium]|nr:ABC transporter permease [Burkholderiales bacterium]
MNLARLSVAYLKARPLNTVLNLVLLALGVGTIALLLLANHQIEERMGRDARGIDLVAGAKGSPMQLILSTVFHVDAPTGNIPLAEAKKLAQHRAVKLAIPLALGDSFRGFRIVGTTHDYVGHYAGELAAGRLWEAPMEAVLGAETARTTGLGVGGKFVGSHGFAEGGEEHGEFPYAVVGVLKPTGTVLDRLVLTNVESVWFVHIHPERHDDPGTVLAHLREDEQEITALLIQYATPIAAATLPRMINSTSALQAASPAYESARLFRMLGVGIDVLRAFALVLVAAAGLSIFIALYNAMEERRYDLAVMRMLGASRGKLMRLVLLEAVALALAGAVIGLGLGHLLTEAVGAMLAAAQQPSVTGAAWLNAELWLVALAAGVGLVAGLVPAWRAYRTDIATTLAQA